MQRRVYGHLSKSGLVKKMVKTGAFKSERSAKRHVENYCFIQYVFVKNKADRVLLEHFLISVLNPKFND